MCVRVCVCVCVCVCVPLARYHGSMMFSVDIYNDTTPTLPATIRHVVAVQLFENEWETAILRFIQVKMVLGCTETGRFVSNCPVRIQYIRTVYTVYTYSVYSK